MAIFSCVACREKDRLIHALEHQIQMLEKLVFPKSSTKDIPFLQDESTTESDRDGSSSDGINAEADSLISGNFGSSPDDEG